MIKNILKQKLLLFLTAFLLFLFILTMASILIFDERQIGESMSFVGLATINESIFNVIGASKACDVISDMILILSLLICLCMASLGGYKLIKEKKLDLTLVILGAFYLLLLIAYIVFDHIHINYSPLLKDGEPKESFPSSHVLASVFILLSAVPVIGLNIDKPKLRICLVISATFLSILMVVFRLLSGWHWLTDILAGEMLALFFVSLYALIVASLRAKVIELGKKDEKELH